MAKHHFVPQFYLKGFVDPSSQDSRNPYLWIVDLQNGTVKRRGPENVANIAGFYQWEELGDGIPSVEKLLSQVESRAAPVISRLREDISSMFPMSMQDRLDVSFFLGCQLARTPSSRKLVENSMQVWGQDRICELVQDEEWLRQRLKGSVEDPSDDGSRLTAERIRRDFLEGRLVVRPRPDHVLGATLELAHKYAEMIFIEMYWLFLLVEREASLLTSDHPVFTGKAQQMSSGGRRIPEHEIAFPISPSGLLLLHQYERLRVVEGIDALVGDRVDKVNHITLRNANRYVFCSSEQQGKWALETSAQLPGQVSTDK